MNKDNYKTIAKLIKHYGKLIPEQFILGLSDYFEKEDNPIKMEKGRVFGFDRKQFLKDCGLE